MFQAYPLPELPLGFQANVRSFAINYPNQVVGSLETANGRKGFRLGGSGPTGLDTLDPSIGTAQSEALGLNNAGMAVGWATRGNGVRRATLWKAGSSVALNLRTLKSATVFDPNIEESLYSAAMGIQPHTNKIVGASINRNNVISGFILDYNESTTESENRINLSKAQDIGNIACNPESRSEARAINTGGEHVGAATVRNGQYHAFIRLGGQAKDCGFTDLGVLSSINSSGIRVWGTSSIAMGLNNYGLVVGSAHEPLTGSSGAFVWRKGWPLLRRLDELVYPTTPGWQLKEAYGVNDSGMIVGWGYYYGIPRGFVAVPGTPPPPQDPEYNP